jgi:hypothetical protein
VDRKGNVTNASNWPQECVLARKSDKVKIAEKMSAKQKAKKTKAISKNYDENQMQFLRKFNHQESGEEHYDLD